jgi:hypothetical protein
LTGDGKSFAYLQKVGVAEVLTGVDRVASKLLLNAQELVVLGQALRARERKEQYVRPILATQRVFKRKKERKYRHLPARSTSLDLASAETNNNVGNGEVLGLTGAVRDHDAPSGLLGEDGSLNSWETKT